MPTEERYLLDELQTADMLEIDGLHAFEFTLNEELLDQAEAAAEAGQPFASDEVLVRILCLDGREKRHWQFSYNSVMEAEFDEADACWVLGDAPSHRLQCLGAISAEGDD
jgi:hypothetical protein